MKSASVDSASVDDVMSELQARVREHVRTELLAHGGPEAFDDAALFGEVDAFLRGAAARSQPPALLLPELLGPPDSWRLDTAMRYQSHRASTAATAILALKRRVLMPVLRWLFEYSRDNFERQRRVNDVLFACVQELTIETVRLRREVHRLSSK